MNEFCIGDHVEKTGGDCSYSGEIVAVFSKKSGAIRYVVEFGNGLLHIESGKTLKRKEDDSK